MRIYLDSSAAVKLFSNELESKELANLIRDAIVSPRSIFISRLTRLETVRSLRRKGIDPSAAIDFFQAVDMVDLKTDDLKLAESVKPESIRSLDAIHLSVALRIKDLGASFVSYDKQLIEAAVENGLEVLSPGS